MSILNFKEKLNNSFEQANSKELTNGKAISFDYKQQNLNKILTNGLPTFKSENWKYTNLNFLNSLDFEFAKDNQLLKSESIPQKYKGIVLNNGKFDENLSDLTNLNNSVEIHNLIDPNNFSSEEIRNHFIEFDKIENNPFININNAFLNGGIVIKIAKNKIIEEEIQIFHLISQNSDSTKSVFSNSKILIIAEENSYCKIVEKIIALDETSSISNSLTKVELAQNSQVKHYLIQSDNKNLYSNNFTIASQSKDSNFTNYTITLSGKFVRNDLHAILNGSNSESHFYGFYYADQQSLVDNHTFVDHAVEKCQSNELYKGILNDRAVGVFNGKIMVRQDAQETNAYQSSKNILLSDDAKMNSKPELEIYADNVKCSHGASTGTIDPDQLFYLKARGIGEKLANSLLLQAFANDVISKIEIVELKNDLEVKLSGKFLNF